MEERAAAAEKKAQTEAKACARAEKHTEELTKTIASLMDTSVMEDLKRQIIDPSTPHADR